MASTGIKVILQQVKPCEFLTLLVSANQLGGPFNTLRILYVQMVFMEAHHCGCLPVNHVHWDMLGPTLIQISRTGRQDEPVRRAKEAHTHLQWDSPDVPSVRQERIHHLKIYTLSLHVLSVLPIHFPQHLEWVLIILGQL